MKKQFATNLDERVIKALKLAALEEGTNVNEILEALVCDLFNSDKMDLIGKLKQYRENKEEMLNYISEV